MTHGPLEDSTGRATRVLRQAVAYQGSPVAFIQMLAAMDRDGEIERSIKGKRTFRIAGVDRSVTARESQRAFRAATEPPVLEIDYDRLARAVVSEFLGRLATASAFGPPEPHPGASDPENAVRAENARLIDERNDYARRLEEARRKLDELLGPAGSSTGEDSRPNVVTSPSFRSPARSS